VAKNFMRYDLMVQDALKGVVRQTLERVAKSGLPGEHHLYITFRTDYAGVELSPMLRSRYPQEMTVVLQHQFWDLKVTEDAFEVGLSFNRMSERLRIPFAAIRGFYDPSVKFGLEFQVESGETAAGEASPALPAKAESKAAAEESKRAEIVSLDSFRKKS
jgi:hypothetical protein